MKISQIKGNITLVSILKVVALIIIVLFFAGMFIGFMDISNARQEVKAVKEINNMIDSQGITDNAKKAIDAFIKKYPRTANIIVCDANGTILFKANDQIVNGKTTFNVSPDNKEPGFYKMKEGYTKFFPVPSKIEPFSFMPNIDQASDNHNQRGKDNENRFSKSRGQGPKDFNPGRLFINSFSLDDKGMRIHYLSGHFQQNKMIEMLSITHGVVRILFLLFWILLAIWVFKDSKVRGLNKAFWGLLTLFTGLIGLAIYLLAIYRLRFCNVCKHRVEKTSNYCQECGTVLKTKCAGCGDMVDLNWNYCSNCGKAKNDAEEQVQE